MRVTVRNPEFERQHLWFFTQPKYFEYEGDEVKLKHVDSEQYLCLTTGQKDFPVRVIDRTKIIGSKVTVPNKKETKVIKGSKGQEYILTKTNNRWSCTCPGFEFRKDCKHVRV